MTEIDIDLLVENLTTILPVLIKKLHKLQYEFTFDKGISFVQIRILFALKKEGKINMSSLGRKLEMQKPNVTVFVDKLIAEGLAERVPQENDRRVILIGLTETGSRFIQKLTGNVKALLKSKIQNWDEKDLKILNNTMMQAHYLIDKLEGRSGMNP